MKRRLLVINTHAHSWHLQTLNAGTVAQDPREDYLTLSGEALCQYLLRCDSKTLIVARGPLPFLAGNKATVGYISPLTGVPHYSLVGGRAAAELTNLGLDAICFRGAPDDGDADGCAAPMVMVRGRAPNLTVSFEVADDLPAGQRSAYYWLREREGSDGTGSIFTLGEGARLGYRSANLAVEAIYHAGRGGAGAVLGRHAAALVLRGEPIEMAEVLGDVSPSRNPNTRIAPLIDKQCARLSGATGGTIVKLQTTGGDPAGRNTLPARNARQMGYALADLGGARVLRATRHGHASCHWCPVSCRHWHRVPADYAPDGYDLMLDDFEPAYAVFAMLGLEPREDTLRGRLDLLAEVDRRLMLPIEEMGCDVMDIGTGLAALFEGLERGIIPREDVPDLGAEGADYFGKLGVAARALEVMRSSEGAAYPALQAVGGGPQALAERYPAMGGLVFSGGPGTLGNAGHCNALWTFLMPLGRFFGHSVGQAYKIEGDLPPPDAPEEAYRALFAEVVGQVLRREFFWLLGNVFSQCVFTFVVFSQDGRGERLSDDDLLVEVLRLYGIQTSRSDLEWFSQAFWCQSMDLKRQHGWRAPAAADLPERVYEALSLALNCPADELCGLMDLLIDEWKRQAGEVMARFGYDPAW